MRELLMGFPARLRYTHRFNTCRVSHPESVAEHCFYVALAADAVFDWIASRGEQYWLDLVGPVAGSVVPAVALDKEKLRALEKALKHDLEESRTGDFPRPFKHSDSAVKQALTAAADAAMATVCARIWPDDQKTAWNWINVWRRSKDTSYAGRVVEFCDFLSVLSFFAQEALDNNASLREHFQTMASYIGTFDDPAYDFIRPLVQQANEEFGRAFGRNSDGSETAAARAAG